MEKRKKILKISKELLWISVLFFLILNDKTMAFSSYGNPNDQNSGTIIQVDTLAGEDNGKNDGKCSLPEALLAANTNEAIDSCPAGGGASADTITITIPGKIKIAKTLNIDSDVILQGNEQGTIIDGSNTFGAVHLEFDNISLSNLEFINVPHNSVIDISSYNGGDDQNVNEIYLKNLYIHDNDATAIDYNKFIGEGDKVVHLQDSKIINNHGEKAGGISVDECEEEAYYTFYIDNSLIINNESDGDGGGVYNACGHLVISNSSIIGNTASRGGGIFINKGREIFLKKSQYVSTKTEIYNTTIVNNNNRDNKANDQKKAGSKKEKSKQGDGIGKSKAKKGGGKREGGSGIYIFNKGDDNSNYAEVVIIKNSTIAKNQEGGIFSQSKNVNIYNTVIVNNNGSQDEFQDCDVQQSWYNKSGNIDSDKSCNFNGYSQDVGLNPLNDNGGNASIGLLGSNDYILTMLPNKNSLLIDSGDMKKCLNNDARNVSRPQNKGCDIGAIEVKSKIAKIGSSGDQDGDGISDNEEMSAPNNGDGNGDGIPDAQQDNVTTYKDDLIGDYITMSLSLSQPCKKSVYATYYKESDLAVQDSQYDYFLGLNGNKVNCGIVGGTAKITYYWNKKYDTSKWLYRKFLSNKKKYVDFSNKVTYGIATVGGKEVTTVTFNIKDGGEYDADGIANGTILDPSGPVLMQDEKSSIGNYIWLDKNGDGKQDKNEKGLEDIRVKLIWYGPNGKYDHGKKDDKVWRTDTNHNGHYKFENLPKGKYKVIVKEEDVVNYIQTYDESGKLDNKATVVLRNNDKHTKADFGYKEEYLAKTGGNLWMPLVGIFLSVNILFTGLAFIVKK